MTKINAEAIRVGYFEEAPRPAFVTKLQDYAVMMMKDHGNPEKPYLPNAINILEPLLGLIILQDGKVYGACKTGAREAKLKEIFIDGRGNPRFCEDYLYCDGELDTPELIGDTPYEMLLGYNAWIEYMSEEQEYSIPEERKGVVFISYWN